MRFKLTPRTMLLAALCVCLTGCELWLKNTLASNTGRIVFTSLRDGNAEIYVMDAHGRNQENLTNHPADDRHPDWSPDGTKIAFASSRDGSPYQIYEMDADGENVIRLTEGQGRMGHPDWSPDGGKIAFSIEDREYHIDVMDADGRNREKLENQALYPSWSPDGKQIACVSFGDGHGDIYVMRADGQGLKRVARGLGGDRPSFSPDGRRIAYMAGHEGSGHIYVVGADGKNPVRLTHNEESHRAPAWSPDGQVIAYYVWDGILGGNLHGTIHLIASDGRYIRQLSDAHDTRDYDPDISPLGLAVFPASISTTTWGRLKKAEPNRR